MKAMMTRGGTHTLAALALVLASCAADVGPAEGFEEEVEQSAQALGSWAKLADLPLAMSVVTEGDTFTVLRRHRDSCGGDLQVIGTETGIDLQVPNLPFCSDGATAGSDANGVFVGDSNFQRIYSLGASSGAWVWNQIASTPGNAIFRVVPTNTHVYWSDSAGIHRVPRGGGQVQTLWSTGLLIGVDGSYFYSQSGCTGPNACDLKKHPITGQTPTTLRTQGPNLAFATFDANFFYFVEGNASGATFKLRRLTKSGSTLATLFESATIRFAQPLSNGRHLYWWEHEISTGKERVHRMTLADGVHTSTPFNAGDMDRYWTKTTGTAGMYVVTTTSTNPETHAMYRGAL